MEYSKDVSTAKGFGTGLGVSSMCPDVSSVCSQVLGHPVSEQHLPDVSLIGELSDPAELGKLLQLVLGCAISCEKKQGMRRARGGSRSSQRTPGDLCFLANLCLVSASRLHLHPQNISREL